MAKSNEYQVAFSLNSKLAAGFNKNFSGAMKSVAKLAAGVAGAYIGFRAVSGFLKESEEAAKAQIEAETKLQSVLKNTKGITDAHVKSIKDYASTLQNAGIIGDEVALAGVQQLGTYQLQADTLKKLMPGMNDLIAQTKGLNATQGDAVSVGNMIGKVMSGQVGALSRAGIIFDKTQEKILKFGTEEQKAATLAEVLKQNVGGVNEALAKTDQGKIQQFTNSWGDAKEEVGKYVLAVKANVLGLFGNMLPKVVNKFKTSMIWIEEKAVPLFKTIVPKAIDWVKKRFELIGNTLNKLKTWGLDAFEKIKGKVLENQPLLEKIKKVVDEARAHLSELGNKGKDAFEMMQPALMWLKDEGLPFITDGIMWTIEKAIDMYNTIKDNWGAIEPIVLGIAGGLAVYKVATMAAAAQTKILDFWTKAHAKSQGILNAVMNLSPLAKWAIIIGAAVAAGVYLYKNWDTIKAKAAELWSAIKNIFGNIGGWFQEKWNAVLQTTMTIWNNIKDFLSTFPLGQAFLQNINNMVDAVKEIFNGVTIFIQGVFSGNWKQAWEGIQGIFSGIVSGWAAIFKIPINNIIGMINTLISGLNKIDINIPDWVPSMGGKSFGIKIPTIPQFAKGTNSTPRGAFIAGEKGPELITGAPGRKVFTNAETKSALSQTSAPIHLVFSPTITISGGNENTRATIQKLLAEEKKKLFAEFKQLLKRERGLAYDTA